MNSNPLPPDHDTRIARATLALDGLSVGDAFGQQFFYHSDQRSLEQALHDRIIPRSPWPYTDDTEMALAIMEVLRRKGNIDQEELAHGFARRFAVDPMRGYGAGAMGILHRISRGAAWQQVSAAVFEGTGSMGNGAAMRVAPIGAYFADDVQQVIDQARLSSEITHAHPEGQAGGIAIALACAWAVRWHEQRMNPRELFDFVLDHVPQSETRTGIVEARRLALDLSVVTAVSILGNGSRVVSQDTVPFTLWCAARHLDDYPEAMWQTVSGLGDRDTTCAIVGGIVALSAGADSIPESWVTARENLILEI